MAELKENLAKLDDIVPLFPGKVAAVARSAEALEQTATALLAQFEQKKAEVLKLTGQVKQALTELEGEGTDQEGAIRNAADAAETAVEGAQTAIQSERDQLMAAVDDAGDALSSLQDHLTAAETR